jgi:DNA-directed RNA polymerase subunit beta'
MIAEKKGTVKFVDLVIGIALRDETDDATGMTQKNCLGLASSAKR